jgi:hypothetical protein
MTVCDFARSYLMFRIDTVRKPPITVSQTPPFTVNNARFQIECRCRIRARAGGPITDYYLSPVCLAEQVNVAENIWHEPSAEMSVVLSAEEFLVLKDWDRSGRGVMLDPPSLGMQPERQAGKNTDAFDRVCLAIRETPAKILETTRQIIDAGLENRTLVGRSEFVTAGVEVLLEYPIKLINVSERDEFYQVDTGPVLVPDSKAFDGKHAISALRKAFVAHNSLGCTELLVRAPTSVGSGISVNHYSRVLKVEGRHWMLEVA